MYLRTNFFYKLIAPIMIIVSILGFTFRSNLKKNFYLPIGIIGIYLIIERELRRKSNRKNILHKIKFFSKNK